MKTRSGNLRSSSIKRVIMSIKAKVVEIINYEHSLEDEIFFNSTIINDLEAFKAKAEIIIAGRKTGCLFDICSNFYKRDVFGCGWKINLILFLIIYQSLARFCKDVLLQVDGVTIMHKYKAQ